jgi:hypothetical protein
MLPAFGSVLVLGIAAILLTALPGSLPGSASDGKARDTTRPPQVRAAQPQGKADQPPDQGEPRPAEARAPVPQPHEGRAPGYAGPIGNGSYQIRPVADPGTMHCLGVGTGRDLVQSVVRSSCTATAQHVHRFELVADGVYRIRPYGVLGSDGPCLTIDGATEGTRLSLQPCAEPADNQRFTLTAAGRSPEYGPLYQLHPAHTRAQNMCVGLAADPGQAAPPAGGAAAPVTCDPRAPGQRMALPRA